MLLNGNTPLAPAAAAFRQPCTQHLVQPRQHASHACRDLLRRHVVGPRAADVDDVDRLAQRHGRLDEAPARVDLQRRAEHEHGRGALDEAVAVLDALPGHRVAEEHNVRLRHERRARPARRHAERALELLADLGVAVAAVELHVLVDGHRRVVRREGLLPGVARRLGPTVHAHHLVEAAVQVYGPLRAVQPVHVLRDHRRHQPHLPQRRNPLVTLVRPPLPERRPRHVRARPVPVALRLPLHEVHMRHRFVAQGVAAVRAAVVGDAALGAATGAGHAEHAALRHGVRETVQLCRADVVAEGNAEGAGRRDLEAYRKDSGRFHRRMGVCVCLCARAPMKYRYCSFY
eukprot:Rhum_TRINITY_DN837_c0_g1::Rhum_TRINITY_DN837_c0_g1_i1::g.2514::m.2514